MRQEHDPIDRLREYILSNKVADEAKLKDFDREIKEIVSVRHRIRPAIAGARSGGAVDRYPGRSVSKGGEHGR